MSEDLWRAVRELEKKSTQFQLKFQSIWQKQYASGIDWVCWLDASCTKCCQRFGGRRFGWWKLGYFYYWWLSWQREFFGKFEYEVTLVPMHHIDKLFEVREWNWKASEHQIVLHYFKLFSFFPAYCFHIVFKSLIQMSVIVYIVQSFCYFPFKYLQYLIHHMNDRWTKTHKFLSLFSIRLVRHLVWIEIGFVDLIHIVRRLKIQAYYD